MNEILADGEVLGAFVTVTIICFCFYLPNILHFLRERLK